MNLPMKHPDDLLGSEGGPDMIPREPRWRNLCWLAIQAASIGACAFILAMFAPDTESVVAAAMGGGGGRFFPGGVESPDMMSSACPICGEVVNPASVAGHADAHYAAGGFERWGVR